jgi:hypothetical protein
MSYALSTIEYGMTDDYAYSLYGSMSVGSNGDPNGDPTMTAGDDQGEEVWGYQVWDSDTSDGFDTGNVPVDFTGDTSGNESLTVGSSGPLTYAGDSFGSISSVQLQAGVQIPASASWSNVVVSFYNGSQLLETDCVASGPSVNTINTPSTPAAEQVLTVIPTAQNATSVSVSGNMRMTSPNGNPGSADMFCNIFINS